MAQVDYSHGSDKVFRIIFPAMFVGFAGGATYCWLNGHLVNAIILSVLALLAIGGIVTALRLGGIRQTACDALRRRLKDLEVKRVLDVGTGKGYLAILLARDGFDAVGEDISAGNLDIARTNAEAEGVEVELVLGSTESMGLPEESFDAVISLQLLHEVKDKAGFVGETHGLLVDGGRFAMVDFRRSPGLFCLMWFAMFRALSASAAQQLIEKAGFREVVVEAISPVHQLISGRK